MTWSLVVLISGLRQNLALVQMAGLLLSFTTDYNLIWWGFSFMTERQHWRNPSWY